MADDSRLIASGTERPIPPISSPPYDAPGYSSSVATVDLGNQNGMDAFVSTDPQLFKLKIFDLNIKGAPSKWRRPHRFGQIKELIKSSGADVVTLQETFPARLVRKLFTREQLYQAYQEVKKDPGQSVWGSGLTTLTKEQVKRKFFSFSEKQGWELLANKGVLLTELENSDGVKTHIYNVHLQSSYSKIDSPSSCHVRLKQLRELLFWIQENSPPEITVLVVGDFNFIHGKEEYENLMDPHSGLYQTLDPAQFKWIDVMKSLLPNNPLSTFDWNKPQKARRLDYLFLRLGTGWQWNSGQSEVELIDTQQSDHKAVQFSLALDPPPILLQAEEKVIASLH